jgi:hypothetical protein
LIGTDFSQERSDSPPPKLVARVYRRSPMTHHPSPVPVLPGRYRHYKGNEYRVLGVGRHTETEEPLVIYQALYGERGLWARPAAMFGEAVVVDGVRQPRFVLVAAE